MKTNNNKNENGLDIEIDSALHLHNSITFDICFFSGKVINPVYGWSTGNYFNNAIYNKFQNGGFSFHSFQFNQSID